MKCKTISHLSLGLVMLLLHTTVKAQTFTDNFSNENTGAFPSKWQLIKGSAQIGNLDGSSVILLSNRGIITPRVGSKNYLSGTFTLQFDAFFDEVKKTINDQYYRIRFWDGSTHATFISTQGNGSIDPVQIYRHRVVVTGRGGGSGRIQHNVSDNDLEVKTPVWRSITIDYNQGALKILIDQTQILNIPDFYLKPAMISIEGVAHEFGYNLVRAIKNIRLDGMVNTAMATTNTNNPAENATNTNGQTDSNASPGNTGIKINDLLDGKSDPGGSSVFLGLHAGMANTSADNKNTGVGFESLKNNTTGEKNTSLGYESLLMNTTGGYNTAIGAYSLTRNSTGNFNTGMGNGSLDNNTIGNNNTATGYRSLFSNKEGSGNIAVGYKSGHDNSTGSGNVFLGFHAGYKETGSNKLYIENSDADANTALIYGEFDKNILRTNGRFQIGNPGNGGYAFPASDGSDKQILQTDGKGNLRWVNITSSGDNNLPQQIDSSNASNTYSGLEAIDEGNGIGWRIKGRDTSSYGNIGLGAVDLSTRDYGLEDNDGMVWYPPGDYGATGNYSFTRGMGAKAKGEHSTAIGVGALATGQSAIAIGVSAQATGIQSFALGSFAKASGSNSLAMLMGTASGRNSIALGNRIKAESVNVIALGRLNIGGGDPEKWIETDPLFEIGNCSYYSLVPKNAFTVLKNGNIGITTHQPKVKLHITDGKDARFSSGSGYVVLGEEDKNNLVFDNNEILARNNGAASTLYLQNSGGNVSVGGKVVHTSDMRLKKNIALLSYGLNEILKMKPVIYDWKNNSDLKHKSIGLLAQDIQPLIKEIVQDNAGTLSISYTELIPILIKAIQEQQNIIDQQKRENDQLNNKIDGQYKKYEELLRRIEELENLLKQKVAR